MRMRFSVHTAIPRHTHFEAALEFFPAKRRGRIRAPLPRRYRPEPGLSFRGLWVEDYAPDILVAVPPTSLFRAVTFRTS